MMSDQVALALSQIYVAERLAMAEKEHLLVSAGQSRAYTSVFAAWAGSVLVRLGRRLEAIGGAAHPAPSFEMRQRVV